MKRQLSLVLALVMILGSFSAVFAAEATVEETAGAFLAKNGVLSGYAGSNDLGLEDNLLRQDTLVLVARLLGEFDEAKAHEGEVTYEDVNDPTYVPLAAWAKENDTFVGHSDARFGFGENLTAQEYAKVLLVALDYTVGPNGDKDVNWNNVLTKAKDLGLLADVKVENGTEITRGEMSVMTFNALGINLKGSKETLADKLGIEMPAAEELTAKVLDTENLAEIVVELSNAKLIKSQDALLNPANYTLNNDAKVQHVHLEGNNVVLTLVPYGLVEDYKGDVETLIKGKKFNVTIRNIDPKINKEYKGIVAGDNSIPVVENVEFMGTYGIKVTTSEPIANPLERNFRLDSRTSMIVEQYGRNIILTPYHDKEFDKDAVELTIDQLNDFAGYKSVKSVEDMELSTDDALPKVENVYRSGNKLVVEFDRDVYHDSVESYENRRELGNASFVERRVTFYATDHAKVDTNVVEYTFERDIPKGLEVTIEGVANHFDKEMEKDVRVPAEFRDDHAPAVIKHTEKVEVKSNDLIKDLTTAEINKGHKVTTGKMEITFDKDIEEFKNLKIEEIQERVAKGEYFTLYELDITRRGKDAASDVKITVDKVEDHKITLSFEDIKYNNKDRDFDYILEVRDLSDLTRNRMERDYLDFQVVKIGSKFNVVSPVTVRTNRYFNRDGVEITLEFNDYVNKEEASIAKNYYLNNKLKVDEAIVERDGKTVSLVVYDYKTVAAFLEDYTVLEISPRVRDLKDDNSVVDRFWNLETGKAIDGPNLPGDDTLNTDALEAVVAEAEALNEVDYTAETWAVLVAALELPEVTQEDVDAKEAAVRAAIDALEVVEDGPVSITATYEEVANLFGIRAYSVTIDGAEYSEVTKVTANDKVIEDHEENDGKLEFNFESEVTSLELEIGTQKVTATVK